LCSSPVTDSDLQVTVKAVQGGRVSTYLNTAAQKGQTIEVFPPMGNFNLVADATRAHHYVLFGGGSGITPLMSILKTVLVAEPNSRVTLLYGNRDEQSIIFRDGLERLESGADGRLRVIHLLSDPSANWLGMRGLPTRATVLNLAQDLLNADRLPKSYWMCGPAPMMEEATAALGFLNIPKEQIHREVFTAALPDPEAKVADPKRGSYTVKIILDGKEKDVLVKENATILDAAVDAGMDPPYACQMGVCCTCRAKLRSGKVQMDEDEGLSDTEVSQGYILTCQSHPLTSDCVLEYM
jgi:ring-1,2-phenylacetyl-CoA epoxidase subunit PaaE